MPKICPHCKVSLAGKEIPEKDRHLFGGATNFSRIVGIEVSGIYDGILYWECPDCNGRWHRWPEGTWQRKTARIYVEGH